MRVEQRWCLFKNRMMANVNPTFKDDQLERRAISKTRVPHTARVQMHMRLRLSKGGRGSQTHREVSSSSTTTTTVPHALLQATANFGNVRPDVSLPPDSLEVLVTSTAADPNDPLSRHLSKTTSRPSSSSTGSRGLAGS